MSDLALSNIEALAQDETAHAYAERTEDSIEVWDDETQTYKKITTINCTGKGNLDC